MNKLTSFLTAWRRNPNELYHGTSTQKTADNIIKIGLRPNQNYDFPSFFTATKLDYALAYTYGIDTTSINRINAGQREWCKNLFGEFGFLFVAEETSDVVVTSLSYHRIGDALYHVVYSDGYDKNEVQLIGFIRRVLGTERFDRIVEDYKTSTYGDYGMVLNDLLCDMMTPEQKKELYDLPWVKNQSEFMHVNVIIPVECWRISRDDLDKMTPDCSNFFDFATLYWRKSE